MAPSANTSATFIQASWNRKFSHTTNHTARSRSDSNMAWQSANFGAVGFCTITGRA